MPRTSYARTLGTIVTETYRICGDVLPDGTFGKIWRWEEVRDAVNRAVFEAVDRTGALRYEAAIIRLVEGVNVYDLPADCVRLLRVNLHGMEGWVVLPVTVTEMDLCGSVRSGTGDPTRFFREFLEPDQIGVYPAPGQDGSSFTRDSQYGILRGIQDADGNTMPFDATIGGLRRIRGVPFTRTGDGQIIREILSPYGNMTVHYIRAPFKMVRTGDYPDSNIPEWFHSSIRYGAACNLLKYRRNKLDQVRFRRFRVKWIQALMKLQRRIEHQGPMAHATVPV